MDLNSITLIEVTQTQTETTSSLWHVNSSCKVYWTTKANNVSSSSPSLTCMDWDPHLWRALLDFPADVRFSHMMFPDQWLGIQTKSLLPCRNNGLGQFNTTPNHRSKNQDSCHISALLIACPVFRRGYRSTQFELHFLHPGISAAPYCVIQGPATVHATLGIWLELQTQPPFQNLHFS